MFLIWVVFTLLALYLYLGFPLLLWLFSRLFKLQHRIDESYQPTVTLIISAFNEESVIREKLENSLLLEYPSDKLQILVISDCSCDRTDEIVEEFSSPRVKLLRMAERTGKTVGLNRAIEQIDSELVVFSDANAIYDQHAINKLARHFVDKGIGYVVGRAKYGDSTPSAAGESEGYYWDFEVRIKEWESDLYSVVGGDGALYMIRRELYQPLEKTDINDFVNPLQIVAAGYRGIFDAESFCTEDSAGDFNKEFGRKVRIVNRSFNGLLRVSQLLNPFEFGRFTWMLVSHKLLRWFSPFILLGHFFASLFLPQSSALTPLAYISLLAYLGVGLLALVGWFVDRSNKRSFVLCSLAYYFMLMNLACAYGVVRRLRGDQIITWSTVRNNDTSHSLGSSVVFGAICIGVPVIMVRLFFVSFASAIIFEGLIILLSFILLYTYLGYPLLLLLLRKTMKKSHVTDDNYQPTVTLLVAAYNEADVLMEKLENSLAIDYPKGKLQIMIASDGSTDDTNRIAEDYASQGVRLLALSPNRGKVTALNEAFPIIDSDIVVLSDANVMYRSDTIVKLVRHFADEQIGAVSGKVSLLNDGLSYARAENQYYNIEHYIQMVEGETGSMIGSDGAMYALRRDLYVVQDSDTILDDLAMSMSVVRQGYRLIHDPEACGFEKNIQELEQEFCRKVRIVAGGIQCLLRGNIWPPKHQKFTWIKLISHKLLRWLSGPLLVLLVGLLVSYLWTNPNPGLLVKCITAGIAILCLFELTGLIIPALRGVKPFALVHYLVVMNAASLTGCWRGLFGSQSVTWKAAKG